MSTAKNQRYNFLSVIEYKAILSKCQNKNISMETFSNVKLATKMIRGKGKN